MPLVVPDVSKDELASWEQKLLGKKITDGAADNISFAKKDLPEKHRIIGPGQCTTMEFVANRLNVYVDENKTVTKVQHG